MNLRERILDGRNIFSAIFSLESYVFDKGLLDTEQTVYLYGEGGEIKETIAPNDLVLYHALADKYDMELIEKVIACCQYQLKWLLADKDHLIEARVYFKLKNYDEGKLKLRPMHTARLIDQICIVSILNCLMFEDDFETGRRKLSDLSKLLPHNFYGNIPSTDVQYLFHKWQMKYKEYTENVIEHCRTYQRSHSYLTEVSLDIKNFFPTISPRMLFDYIIRKLKKTYADDIETLSMAVTKLLYFTIREENVEPWNAYYYPDEADLTDVPLYMNCGVTQGLPQSYFFGNLCMVEVKKHLMKEGLFKGDAYFYVDDSVIYIQSKLTEKEFSDKITKLNNGLKEWCAKKGDDHKSTISDYLGEIYLDFQNRLPYQLKFHENGKSVFSHIDDTESLYGPISNIARDVSTHANVSYNLDEIDDHVCLKRLEALNTVISREIEKLTMKQKEAEAKGEKSNTEASKLKLLKRYKKFFLYRNRMLKIREEGGANENMLNEFRERFLDKVAKPEKFFEQFEADIFQSEYRLLIQKMSKQEAEGFKEEIKKFEQQILTNCGVDTTGKERSLFYSKDVDVAFAIKSMSQDIYTSLIRWAKENYSGQKSVDAEKQMMKLRAFLKPEDKDVKENREGLHGIFWMKEYGFEGKVFTSFVMRASPEYQRRILNVYFSEIMDVLPSDALTFTKSNARRLRYAELRILAYLRNHLFDFATFEGFVKQLDDKHVSNQMGIDIGLLEVLNIFIKKVKKPEWVDALIVTHRLTKGLWYNGSKFLNSYTLHNEEHAVTLIMKSVELTNRIDFFVLKDIDFYILFLACYLHDISLVIHPDMGRLSSDGGKNMAMISGLMGRMKEEVEKFETVDVEDKKNSRYKNAGRFLVEVFDEVYGYFEAVVRDNHAKDSAKFIGDRSNTLLGHLEKTLLSYVAKVSESHGYDVMDVYGRKSRAKDETISIKFLMILIRLADLLDVANDRVNYHLLRQNLKYLSRASRFHWISHLVTDTIVLDVDYKVEDETDMGNKPITEVINLELHLNFKQLTVAEKPMKCEGCKLVNSDKEDRLLIKIIDGEKCGEECTVLCCWMMKKHEWLVKELIALNDYLYSVNNSLYKTEVNFIVRYRDDMKLDADMFDSVQEYLGG